MNDYELHAEAMPVLPPPYRRKRSKRLGEKARILVFVTARLALRLTGVLFFGIGMLLILAYIYTTENNI